MKRTLLFGIALTLTCLALVLTPTQSSAQAVYGSILGTVTDTTGAAVPGAKVSVTSVKQATTVNTVSNETGNYSVEHLIPGDYAVKVEASNFKSAENTAVTVNADTASKVDMKLEVGAISQTVDVTAQPDLLKTDKSDVAVVFNEKAVSELPLFNRNFTQLELSAPGTQRLVGWSHAATEDPQGGQQIFVNGQHFSGTAFELDGTDNQDPILGIIVINPTLESVTEAKITTQNYDAQFGKAIAGVVASQTKSGSNSLHGSVFGFRRSDALQARNPYTQSRPDPISGRLVPPSKWTQYGGSIGGPIKKDKTFYFGDYQGTRRTTGTTQQVTVPTALVRSTCLAAVGNCNLSEYLNGGQGQIYGNPATPDGKFVGNLIPVSLLSAPAVALLRALPAPATAGTNNNLTGSGAGPYDDDEFNVRVDHAATQNLHLFGRYSLADYRLSGKGIFGALGGPGFGQGGLAGSSKSRDQSIASGFDYALSPTLLTDFRFGYLRYHVNANKFDVGTAPATAFGIPGLNTGSVATSGLPGFFVDGITNFGEALNITRCNCGLIEEESQVQFVNNWTKTISNHSVKFGGDIRYARNLRVPSDANRAGQLSFSKDNTSSDGRGGVAFGSGGLGLATFLLGNVTHFERYVSSSLNAAERQKRWFFYGQDLWRITPRLTVNYGTRYELYFPESVNGKGNGGFGDLANGTIRVAGVGGIGLNGNVKNTFSSFAPRIGVSYQIDPKTVVRLGYGRSFDIGVFGSIFGHTVTQNLPVLVNQSPPGDNRTALFTLTNGPAAFVFDPVPANGLIPFKDGANTKIRPTKMRLPTLDAWNLAVERQISSSMTAEVAYVGNKGTHVFAGNGPAYNINQPSIVGFGTIPQAQRRPFFGKFNTNGVVCCSGDLTYLGDSAGNNYNALQAKLTKRLSQGLQFTAHYTWSRAMNYNDDYFNINPYTSYGPDDYNRRHVFVVDMLYELPIGRGRQFMGDMNRFADAILGGWQLSTITNVSSGLPFTASYSECGQDRDTGPCRPNRIGSFSQSVGSLVINGGSPYRTYFTPVAPLTGNGVTSGAFSRPARGTFGGSRNSFYGPRFFSSDMGLLKNFTITERFKARFTADAFNIFNHPIQAIPGNTCIDCIGGDAGRITNIEEGTQMRNFQFGLKFSF